MTEKMEFEDYQKWYAVYTRSKCEKAVEADISQICTTYLPLKIVRRRWSDRYKVLELPLIPSYFFVKFSEEARLQIYRHPNVITILGINGRLNPIPEREIELVRKIESSRLPFDFTSSTYPFRPGDRVVINAGPLMGTEGYLEKFLNRSKVYIHIPSLQGFFTAKLEDITPHHSLIEAESSVAL